MTGAKSASETYGKRKRGTDKEAEREAFRQRSVGDLLQSAQGIAEGYLEVVGPKGMADQAGHLGLEAEQIADDVDATLAKGGAPDKKKLAFFVRDFLAFRDRVNHEWVRMLGAIKKRATEILSRFKGSSMTVQLEDRDELQGVLEDLTMLMVESPMAQGSYASQPSMLKISRPNTGRRSVRGQLESVAHILEHMPAVFGFDEEALDPIREVASRLHQDPGDYETGRDLMGLMLQLNQELDEEREDPNYPPKTRRDMLAFAGIARGVAEALRDIYYGDPAQVTTEDSELLMERGKVGFMQSQNKRVMRKRARQRVDAMKRLIDLTVKEMGGGERGADSVKKKLDAILKHKHGDDQVGDTIKRAKNTMNTYLKRYKVSKGVRRTLMGQFFALREDFGQGLVVPQWAQQHMTWAKANTGLDFWELGDEPEAPLERSAPKKPGSVNKVLRDLGQTISMPGMSMKKTRDLLADPFGVA